ncbi:MAG: lipoprotein [Gammaproteobacteria bacterium]
MRCSLALLLLLGLAACGQKGPLYLPDEEQASIPAPNQNA